MKVLVTGGAGYIGSTVCSALLDAGHTPVILDSLITGKKEFTQGREFYCGDIADEALLDSILSAHPDIGCAIHLAALIVVPDSVARPYEYYRENVSKSLLLFNNLISKGLNKIVFSSSAAMYGDTPDFVVTEASRLDPKSPYSRTKFIIEMMLEDFSAAYGLNSISLRYFNVIGADPKYRTGLHNAMPSHVLGKLVSVADGALDKFYITGTDWPTRDGTGIRDFIHVWDLARAHVLAVEKFDGVVKKFGSGYVPINLGCNNGVTVREMLAAFESVYGRKIACELAPPRAGDVAGVYADTSRAAEYLGWKPELTTEDGIRDALGWSKARKQILGY